MNKKSVLIYILPRSPWPPYAGQSRLAFFRAKELKKKGYKLILISFIRPNTISKEVFEELNNTFHELHLIEIKNLDFIFIAIRALILRFFYNRPLQSSWLASKRLSNKFKKIICLLEKKYKNIIFHFYSIRTYFLWQIIENYRKPFVIDLVDSMTLNLERKCLISNKFNKFFWNYELNASRIFEQNLPNFRYCKKYIVVSKLDKKYLKINSNKNKFFVSSVGYEIRKELKTKNKINKNIIFFGSLSYEPNQSAIFWLLEKVMPSVWAKDPEIILKIAGRKPTRKLINLCKNNKKISLIPNPKSMRECIKNSTISVAPLISGSGQQFKIIEAMANRVPVLSTSKGAKPFGFINKSDLIIADKPKSFANEIIKLIRDRRRRNYLKNNAYKKVKNNFDWEKVVGKLAKNIY